MNTPTLNQLRAWVHDQQRAHRRGFLQTRTQSELNEFGQLFGWGEARSTIEFLSLANAQALCQREGIRAQAAYTAYRACHEGCRLPSEPDVQYGISLRKFFHTERSYLTLRQAQTLCRHEGLTCTVKVLAYCRSHEGCGLPTDPPRFYRISPREFFGEDGRAKKELLRLIRLAKKNGGELPSRVTGTWYKPHKQKQPELHLLFVRTFKKVGTRTSGKWVLRSRSCSR